MHETTLAKIYNERRGRYQERDRRMQRVRQSLTGNLDGNLKRLGTETRDPAVGNLILSTVRTLAQRVGQMPRLHATSRLESTTAKQRAERHEETLAQRLDRMHFQLLLPQAAYWLASSGFQPFTLTYDRRLGQSRIRIRDPLTCYPNTVWPHEPGVEDCLFVYRMSPTEIHLAFPDCNIDFDVYDGQCTVAEFHNADGVFVSIVEPEIQRIAAVESSTGSANVWIARDLTPDFDFYGQFDQVVPIMEAEARLTSLMEAYVEQQVTAETWVIGEITSNDGDVAHGLGAVNVLEPSPGSSVTKLTNNMSPQVFQQLALFEHQQRLTGSIPSALSGEPEVSFATGRGIEKLVAVVDDNVSHYQNILGLTLKEVFGAIPDFEAQNGADTKGFAPDVTVHVQFALGADPAMTVALLQKTGAKMMSRETAMEQDPIFENPQKELERIDVEALQEALLQSILLQVQEGGGDPTAIVELIEKRREGMPLEKAFKAYMEAQAPPAVPGMEAGMEGGGAAPGDLDLASMLGLTPSGTAVGGVMGRQEIT